MTRWLLLVALVVLVAVYTSWTAGRLDRLHARVDAAWAGLDAALVRRASAARAVVACLPVGPEAVELARAATAALAGGPVNREAVENELSRALRTALPLLPHDPGTLGVREELGTAMTRVGFARSFHNSAVSDTRMLRRKRYPRALRLAGHRVLPQHFDIDEAEVGVLTPGARLADPGLLAS